MRRISFRRYAYSRSFAGGRYTFHLPVGWTAIFGVLFFLSAALVPKEIGVVCDPDFSGIVATLKSATGLPWRQRSDSQRAAGVYRIVVQRENGHRPRGWILGRIPLFPAAYRWNPVESITPSQLVRVKNREIRNWSQLGGEARPIAYLSGQAVVRRLRKSPWGLGWVYWPQLTPQIKILNVLGRGFPWRGGPNAVDEFAWAVLEPPAHNGRWFDIGRRLQDLVVRHAVQRHLNSRRWLYGGERAVITGVGDLLFDRGITETAWDKYGDYAYVFGLTVHQLRSSDLVMGNLECPFNRKGYPINMFAGDARAIPALRYGGFDVLSLANNHSMDCGPRGLLDTIDLLEQNGLRIVGAGVNRDEARRPKMITIRGIRIAILAYTEVRLGFTYTRTAIEWRAGADRPGVNAFELKTVREDLARARRMADIVVVLAHWGDEYRFAPNDFQRQMARKILAAGADLVIGHHPHVIQGIGFGRRGTVAYSLGNFVFDQYPQICREGLILEALVDRSKVLQIRLKPVVIEAERPRLLQGEAEQRILRQLGILSKGLDKELEGGGP